MESPNVLFLDAAGAPQPDQAMMADICAEMMQVAFGNPHSSGSKLGDTSLSRTEAARSLVLHHFGVTKDEYDVVFTSGTTASLALVGQCFPWTASSALAYPMNAHTSLLGLRCYCDNAFSFPSSSVQYVEGSHRDEEVCTESEGQTDATEQALPTEFNLLLVPGECNFTGRKADLQKMGQLCTQSRAELLQAVGAAPINKQAPQVRLEGSAPHRWLWLLDAAKLAATSAVDLSILPKQQQPHFVALSFYKIFGYPTGLGALLVRRDVAPLLQKRYYGGGTLQAAAADSTFCKPKRAEPHDFLEDGTPHYYGIAALRHCFAYLERAGGMPAVQSRCFALTQYLAGEMRRLRHDAREGTAGPGVALCVLYGAHGKDCEMSPSAQGPVIAFNLRWQSGAAVGFSEVGKVAAEHNIQLRTGCFCNVGGCQEVLGLSAADVEYNYAIGRVCSDSGHDIINGRPTGAVRVSLGHHSTLEDCVAFLAFLRANFLNKMPPTMGAPPRETTDGVDKCVADINDLIRTPLSKSTQGASLRVMAPAVSIPSAKDSTTVTLAAIFVYPIKSCAGMRVESWPVGPTGLQYDRAWALVDATGKALTQKQHPRLALVQPAISLRDRVLLVRAPGMAEDLVIPLDDDGSVTACDDAAGAGGTVSVCGQVRKGRKISFDADQWFSSFLSIGAGKPVHCSLMRSLDESCATPRKTPPAEGGQEIAFANTAQFLLLSLESVGALTQLILSSNDAARGSLNIKVENFRPNLVVTGGTGQPHQEDAWRHLRVPVRAGAETEAADGSISKEEEMELLVTGPCSRCSMVNVDGTSGSMDCRAFQALATYRKDGSSVYFGQFCSIVPTARGVERVGDPLLCVGAVVHVS